MLRKIINLVLVLSSFSFATPVSLTLKDFANLVANQNHINILISDDINVSKSTFFISDDNKKYAITSGFTELLKKKGFKLYKKQGFYFIDKVHNFKSDKFFYQIKLKHFSFDYLKSFLDKFKVGYDFLKNTNTLILYTTLEKFNSIKNIVYQNDKILPQVKFKITIFSTNLDKFNEKGFNLKSFYTNNNDIDPKQSLYYLNLITMPYNITSPLQGSKFAFYAVLKYLVKKGFTTIRTSPTLLARSYSTVDFKSVKSIPIQKSSTTIKGTNTKQTNSINYNDVGLKISIKPIIYDNFVYFDLNIVSDDVVGQSSLTPTISKREISSSYRIKKGSLLVISGLNRTVSSNEEFGIPLLKDIFIIGNLFKHKSIINNKQVLSISIEVL